MKRLFTTVLLAAFCLSLGAQDDALRLIAENPDRAANNMHSYEFNPIVDTKAPKGFKPFYISHYGRHGSRYEQNSTFARAAMGAFPVLDSLDLLTETGKALYADVNAIVEAHKGMEGSLTPRGAKEHQMLAARMVERFPAVFKNKDRWEVNSFSSTNFRCIVSMCNFTNSMKAESPRQEFTYTSAERFMGYINPSLRVQRPGEVPAPRPSFSPEQMARMRGGNPENAKYTPATGTPGYDFTRFLTPLFKDYDAALKVLGNPEPFVKACFSAGGLCQVIDFLGIDILRKYFVPEELVYLWASGNDSHHPLRDPPADDGLHREGRCRHEARQPPHRRPPLRPRHLHPAALRPDGRGRPPEPHPSLQGGPCKGLVRLLPGPDGHQLPDDLLPEQEGRGPHEGPHN